MGASWALSGKIVSACATLAANALLARLLTPEDLGSYFLTFSIVTMFSVFCIWGLDRGMVRIIASGLASGHPELARNAILTSFLLVTTVGVLVLLLLNSAVGEWIFTTGFNSTLLASLSLLIGVWILIRANQGLLSESFRGFQDIRLATVFGGLVTAVLSMLFYFAVWRYQGTARLDQAIQLTMLASGISLLAGFLLLVRKVRTLKRGRNSALKTVFRLGFPLMITSVSLFGMRELHLWLLAYFQPMDEVAFYGSAFRLVTLLVMPLTIVNAVIPPMVADLYSKQKYAQIENVLQKTATMTSALSFGIFALIILFGADILGLVYGEVYRAAYGIFVILAAGQIMNVCTGSPGILLTMSGHERIVMGSALGAGAIGVIVSFFGVQAFGAIGVAAGFATSLALLNLGMWAYSWRRLKIRTHGSLTVAMKMLRKARARIEGDGTNGGPHQRVDKLLRHLEVFIWQVFRREIIECFGGSHVAMFRGLNHQPWIKNRRFRTTAVRGATAYGIGNPNSRTNALQIFQQRLKSVPKNRLIVFMMGEVDVGFLIWLRAKNNNLDAMTCMKEAWQRYTAYLTTVRQTHPRLVLYSVPLPTIQDGNTHGDFANARREVTASQRERTAMTLEFNRLLKSWAMESAGIRYIDLDPYALDRETLLVRTSLLNKNAADHHYDTEAFHTLIRNTIDELD
jgi:O-antigen/teichoic acid export membrane protein